MKCQGWWVYTKHAHLSVTVAALHRHQQRHLPSWVFPGSKSSRRRVTSTASQDFLLQSGDGQWLPPAILFGGTTAKMVFCDAEFGWYWSWFGATPCVEEHVAKRPVKLSLGPSYGLCIKSYHLIWLFVFPQLMPNLKVASQSSTLLSFRDSAQYGRFHTKSIWQGEKTPLKILARVWGNNRRYLNFF